MLNSSLWKGSSFWIFHSPFARFWGTWEQRPPLLLLGVAYEMDGFMHQCGRIPDYSSPCARCIHLSSSEELPLLHVLLPRKLFTLESWARRQKNRNRYFEGKEQSRRGAHKLVRKILGAFVTKDSTKKNAHMHTHMYKDEVKAWNKAGISTASLPWDTGRVIKGKTSFNGEGHFSMHTSQWLHLYMNKIAGPRWHACLMIKKSLSVLNTLETHLFRNSSSFCKYCPCIGAKVTVSLGYLLNK